MVIGLTAEVQNDDLLGHSRMFMCAPNGKLESIKILPLSEVAMRDDFFNIKKGSRDDLLSAHCVPPHMLDHSGQRGGLGMR